MIPPGLEPGTLRVLGARDNRYTTESDGGKMVVVKYFDSSSCYTTKCRIFLILLEVDFIGYVCLLLLAASRQIKGKDRRRVY